MPPQSHPHIADLRQQARALPEAPGVYFWIDARGRILYIGKAVNLRSRVTSYFSTASRNRRTRELLEAARNIRFEVAASELEALLHESALIKREQPRFNRALRKPRSMYFLKLDGAAEDPYIEIAREHVDDGSLYFGPFHSAAVVRETLTFLHDVLPLRKCTARRPRCRPCLYYQMHTCAAPLLDEEHRRQHQEAIARLNDLLDGREDRVTAWLERKRERLSESLLFERAAEVQERLETLRQLGRRQVLLETAVRCRHVLIWDSGKDERPRLLLVARGSVISVREQGDAGPEEVRRWVRAHELVARAVRPEQSEMDAASVLDRWLRCNRERARWVAVPPELSDEEMDERVTYLLRGAGRPEHPYV